MSAAGSPPPFFTAGGTLHPDAPSYIRRPADDELYQQVRAGQFCYVLTCRQMGKSSLMIRTAERLRQDGVATALVDLSALGSQVSAEQWYLGILRRLAADLNLPLRAEAWWQERAGLGPVQRFSDFLRDAVLGLQPGRTVIFVDEIDSTLGLPFTDDFFAAIRHVYNARADLPAYDRLTFVLLGVAAPTDLIKDPNRTPFNIGRAIDLADFSRHDAAVLEPGLAALCPGEAPALLDRVFYWTDGHPYLTQKVCATLASQAAGPCTPAAVDAAVTQLFFADVDKVDDNLQFVRHAVEAGDNRRPLLGLYRRVLAGEPVPEDRRSPLQNRLKLIGLVEAPAGQLAVRNRIYQHVFNLAWVRANTPVPVAGLIIALAIFISLGAIAAAVLVNQRSQAQARQIRIDQLTRGVLEPLDPGAKLSSLDALCREAPDAALALFRADQPAETQAALHVAFGSDDRREPYADAEGPEAVLLRRTVTCLASHAPGPAADALCCQYCQANPVAYAAFSAALQRPCACTGEPPR